MIQIDKLSYSVISNMIRPFLSLGPVQRGSFREEAHFMNPKVLTASSSLGKIKE